MINYTICFIKKENEILMLNRNKKPNMGMWNGVGGKIEKNESHFEGVIRETYEETGIHLNKPIYVGNVVWKSERGEGGMYVYFSELPKGVHIPTPISTIEGILEWKQIDWIIDKENIGVVENIHYYLPQFLEGKIGIEHQFIYKDGIISKHTEKNIFTTKISNM